MRSSLGAKVALAAFSTILAFLVAEGVVRLLRIGGDRAGSSWFAGGNHPRYLFEPHPTAGYRLRPGFAGRELATSGEFDVAVAVDDAGLRDHRHAAGARPTVLAIGDSMTFGEGVEVEDTYSAAIEARTGYRVVNGGVPGYGSRQMEIRLAELLPIVRPALVIMTLLPAWDEGRLVNPFVYKEGFIVAADQAHRLHLIGGNLYTGSFDLPVIGRITAYSRARSRVVRLAIPSLRRLYTRVTKGRSRPTQPSRQRDEKSDEEIGAIFARAAARTAASGGRFMVVLIDSRNAHELAARQRLEAALRTVGLEAFLLDSVPGVDWEALHYPKDSHWNAAGHRQVGAALAPAVVSCLERRGGCASSGNGAGDGHGA